MQDNNEEMVILWEAPKILPPEFRLYYDADGKVLFYTMEKLEGNYVVITALQFAEARPDLRVIDGKVSLTAHTSGVVSRLTPDPKGKQRTAIEDISIAVDERYTGKYNTWKLITRELI